MHLNSVKLLTITNITIVLCCLLFIIDGSIANSIAILGMNFLFLKYNFFWQPVSSMFVHGGLMHIVMNMVILFQFGNMIEYRYGKMALFLLYYLGGIFTSLFSFLYLYSFDLFSHNIIGASGAISVLIGFVAYVDISQRKAMIAWILAISFLPLILGLNIAWYAHIIGFAIGYVVGRFYETN